MQKYPKIQSVFKRDEKSHKFIEGDFSCPEFEYLQGNHWEWTEKVDGTNIRVRWDADKLKPLRFGGRTDNASIPIFLLERLEELFHLEKFEHLYPETPMLLCGEGYGAKIQKGGGKYKADGVDFVLFDVLIDGWWLRREDVEDVATMLGIEAVPIIGTTSIASAISTIKHGLLSQWGDFQAEGLVLKPRVELQTRAGHRIITKMKHKDFGE